ncbi:hypothetical protein BN946_scf184455.g8 [Trametes cinnabarina]|uniref:Uncharacterized protein n=1 Tax=Pycnoporus cinnabarinus TaxID=5643 RepID=A0A060SX05_PYCCI|nr:hypothetical protein BN946_scf184455.g8 [Trametes cinnabarina]
MATSVFEPENVLALAKLSQGGSKESLERFEKKWRTNVEQRRKGWMDNRSSQSHCMQQLEWEAHGVEYVSWAYNSVKANAPLKADIPLLGPRFQPPTYLHMQRRDSRKSATPGIAYLKTITIVHPLYYPELTQCPRCDAKGSDVAWNGWVATGHREVHGLEREETALGYQLRCARCQKEVKAQQASSKNGEGTYCFATTNHSFWERREHWEIPAGIPFFTKRCAVTRELFNLIIEFRISMTSAGLAEHIHQLHLLRYHRERLCYLSTYRAQLEHDRQSVFPSMKTPLQRFSKPGDIGGYADISITDDMIRCSERRARAKTVDTARKHEKQWGGGILSALNERGQTLGWQFCQTQSNAEIEEFLRGLKRRFGLLEVPDPEIAVSDNCCHVRKAIINVFPDAHVCLDVWHTLMRYSQCILGGSGNSSRTDICNDIVDAILKARADKYNTAVYWPREEQKRRLDAAFQKWAARGMWNALAAKV